MSRQPADLSKQCGSGLVEVMISVVIGMLLVLMIYQIHQVSEAQKRTIISGDNASQNASYATYLISREISMGGSAVASSAAALDGCTLVAPFTAAQLPGGLRAIPVVINAGANDKTPDQITVFYGGSSTLSTPVGFKRNVTVPAPYEVAGAVAFSQGDVIAAVSGAQCTLSTIDAGGVSVVDPCIPPTCAERIATLTHTPIHGSPAVTYTSGGSAALVNLGPATAFARVVYSVDPDCATDAAQCTLRSQNVLPLGGPGALAPPVPIVADVVNLKAEYGLDTSVPPDGIVDTWVQATGPWSFANLTETPGPPLATLQQIRAVRLAVVTRSAEYERDIVTPGPLRMFAGADAVADGAIAVSMNLTPDQRHYRYRVFETVVPLRNAMWNSQ